MNTIPLTKVAIFCMIFIAVCAFIFIATLPDYSQQNNTIHATKQSKRSEIPKTEKKTSTIDEIVLDSELENDSKESKLNRVEQVLNQDYDEFEISFYTKDGDFGTEENGPWEVFAISPLFAFKSCSGAKNTIFRIMKSIYTDKFIKNDILRIQISLSDQASASLGSKDALSITLDDWNSSGPSNFARVLYEISKSKNPELTIEEQTFWEPINGNCIP